jgi:flavin reductase (DIM6/NTAB) family NADH-FMN oxidoreductase RutF
MARQHRTFTLSELRPSQAYDILSGLVVPRPIAFVSTLSDQGVPNLAPFSFFMVGGVRPPGLAFCPVLNADGQPKDSLKNVEKTSEFVVNLVTREMSEGMNASSYPYPEGEDEWDASGFTMLKSRAVKPPRVAESPVQFECRLFKALRHGDGPGASVYVVGEVVVAHIDPSLIDESGALADRFQPIARLGGAAYLDLANGNVFELARPNRPAGSSLD